VHPPIIDIQALQDDDSDAEQVETLSTETLAPVSDVDGGSSLGAHSRRTRLPSKKLLEGGRRPVSIRIPLPCVT
jgi:hypothetical protein